MIQLKMLDLENDLREVLFGSRVNNFGILLWNYEGEWNWGGPEQAMGWTT